MMFTKLFNIFIKTQKMQVSLMYCAIKFFLIYFTYIPCYFFFLQFRKHCGLGTTIFKTNSMCTNASDKINLLSSEEKEKILNIINSKNTEDLLQ